LLPPLDLRAINTVQSVKPIDDAWDVIFLGSLPVVRAGKETIRNE
jgi:hypothetical protein